MKNRIPFFLPGVMWAKKIEGLRFRLGPPERGVK